jgi:TMEM175 potassium channel family protein
LVQNSAENETPGREGREIEGADDLGLARLIYFSDAVFAIAITLLALNITHLPTGLPDATLLQRLLDTAPTLVSFVISFAAIGFIWIGHHGMFRRIGHYDAPLIFLDLLLLMVVAFVPYPTSLLGEYGTESSVAAVFYGLTLALACVMPSAIWLYASHNGRLLRKGLDQREQRRAPRNLYLVPALFAVSAIVGIWWPGGAWAISWIILAYSIINVLVFSNRSGWLRSTSPDR